jgi:microcystin-dependent protein
MGLVIGNKYGGDGVTNFALPDLRDRTLVNVGMHDGVDYLLGGVYGEEANILTVVNMPVHDHTLEDFVPPTGAAEPASLLALALGIIGMLAMRRRALA